LDWEDAEMRTLLTLLIAVGWAGVAGAAVCGDFPDEDDCVINNGLAPLNPENVIDNADDFSSNRSLFVRSVGCPPEWPDGFASAPCPSPGAPTEIEVVDGGYVDGNLQALDSCFVTMSGGMVNVALMAWDSSTVAMVNGTVGSQLQASDSAAVTMGGGTVGLLVARDSSTITIIGGTVEDGLFAYRNSSVTIEGENFKVDTGSGAESVEYGDLSALTGTLTGTLASGDPINSVFYQGGYVEGTLCPAVYPCSGTITLEYAPEPSPGLLCACVLTTLALLRRRAGSGRGRS
jgi:hypothetical protein